MQPRLGQSASFADGGADERVVFTSQLVSIPINDTFCSYVPIRADTDSRIYFKPGFDAGVNTGTYQLWFRPDPETKESAA